MSYNTVASHIFVIVVNKIIGGNDKAVWVASLLRLPVASSLV